VMRVVSLLTKDLSTLSLSVMLLFIGIKSLVELGKALGSPYSSRALPPMMKYITLYLNIFRGKPAISKFD
jgi:hypothetical protein